MRNTYCIGENIHTGHDRQEYLTVHRSDDENNVSDDGGRCPRQLWRNINKTLWMQTVTMVTSPNHEGGRRNHRLYVYVH